MKARIYKPSKTATQSGRAGRMEDWILEYELETRREPESLMGWTSSGDTLNQVRLGFATLEEAKSFAEKKGLTYQVTPAQVRKVKPRNYGDNFKYSSLTEHK
ncbi:MAG: ETC complex I subunit [Alphaproteobacteria bacterium]